jgi:REP element-mobilizing transposase RayT
MLNHVHSLVQPIAPYKLSEILKTWKGYSAREANKLLSRTGTFWLAESFDRIMRSEEDLNSTIDYVVSNPERAGLSDWKWVWKAN